MIEPLKHRVLVQKPEPKKFTESGLTIPESAQEGQEPVREGTILALGKDAEEILSVGDKVLFGKLDGTPVDSKYCDGLERCLIIADNQIRCVINA